MKIIFDHKEFVVSDSSKNIVEIAKENGVYISAPCFYKQRIDGCCKGCLILIDGKEALACETYPVEGMEIIYDREDLMEKRSENLARYATRRDIEAAAASLNSGHSHEGHSCGGSCGDDCSCGDGGCGDNCSCGSH